MKARLLAVQRMLWMLVVASLALCVLAFPRGRNRDYMAALEELTVFRAGFQQKQLETSLLGYARSQGSVPLADIAKRAMGPGVAPVHAKAGGAVVLPRTQLSLGTLEQVQARGAGASTLPIGVLRSGELADAIAWRLSRQPAAREVVLASVKLVNAKVTEAEVALDHDVTRLRSEAAAAQAAFDQASQQLNAAEELLAARKKWKASWKAILKADQSRKEARATLEQCKSDLDQKQKRYEDGAKQALSFAVRPAEPAADPAWATAEVVLEPSGGAAQTLQIPVHLDMRQAALPALQGTAFALTRAADLWDEVKSKTPDEAVSAVQKRFTWQYQYVRLGPLKLGGMTLLHLVPLALPALLLLVLGRIRRVSVSYNPFGSSDNDDLPEVGFGQRMLDLTALSILPFLAGVLDIIALTAVSEIPVVPVLCALGSLGAGVYVYIELGALQSLTDAVTRSRSTPPPPKSGS
jgi:hypothetical protein